ncbi:hypothetical protein PSE_3067 [Pseudovibrio sp. FO-BEG1]|uniref:hypothetical protein n=1 Tax=Pseudovibrio sp. (strain FO-BEG1) TaxID=911045 RepID=UPI000238D3AB|nr:hypothetical protein [Pseudovibrio sp. FO-BEG1]AEV37575.1 hypothetical protein PSE_3067 [Pseudovibrio sp. FO-BEG1]
MSDPLHAFLGIKLVHVSAGFFGGLVRAIVSSKEERKDGWLLWLLRTVGTAIVGALFAGHLTPIAAPFISSWSNVRDASVEGATGFVLGLCGLALSEGLVKIARRWRENPKIPKVGS